MAILPNSNIVSSSADYTIKIWNSTSFELMNTLKGHSKDVSALAILANDSSRIISGSWDGTIKIWQINNNNNNNNETKILNSIQYFYQNSGITTLTFFNYIYLVVGFADSSVKSWNILKINKASFSLFKGKNQAVTCLFNLNNQYCSLRQWM